MNRTNILNTLENQGWTIRNIENIEYMYELRRKDLKHPDEEVIIHIEFDADGESKLDCYLVYDQNLRDHPYNKKAISFACFGQPTFEAYSEIAFFALFGALVNAFREFEEISIFDVMNMTHDLINETLRLPLDTLSLPTQRVVMEGLHNATDNLSRNHRLYAETGMMTVEQIQDPYEEYLIALENLEETKTWIENENEWK